MSQRRRREKAIKRQAIVDANRRKHPTRQGLCLNCGEQGPHFVPPSLGVRGFYRCEKKPDVDKEAILVSWGLVKKKKA